MLEFRGIELVDTIFEAGPLVDHYHLLHLFCVLLLAQGIFRITLKTHTGECNLAAALGAPGLNRTDYLRVTNPAHRQQCFRSVFGGKCGNRTH